MTKDKTPPNTKLPTFQAHVTAVDTITPAHLTAILQTFANGEINPLILGTNDQPEAAIIPFAAFVRLMRYDHATHTHAEQIFQALLSERIANNAATPGETFTSVEDFAVSLGTVGQQWANDRQTDSDSPSDPTQRS